MLGELADPLGGQREVASGIFRCHRWWPAKAGLSRKGGGRRRSARRAVHHAGPVHRAVGAAVEVIGVTKLTVGDDGRTARLHGVVGLVHCSTSLSSYTQWAYKEISIQPYPCQPNRHQKSAKSAYFS